MMSSCLQCPNGGMGVRPLYFIELALIDLCLFRHLSLNDVALRPPLNLRYNRFIKKPKMPTCFDRQPLYIAGE